MMHLCGAFVVALLLCSVIILVTDSMHFVDNQIMGSSSAVVRESRGILQFSNRQLQISDRQDMGAQNFNFALKSPPNCF